jgi:heat shock protein HslJ
MTLNIAMTRISRSRIALTIVVGLLGSHVTAQSTDALEGGYWKAIELAGMPVPAAQSANLEPHLVFQPGRVSGSDGCNRLTGPYERKGTPSASSADGALTFGQLAGTQMACPDSSDIERRFREALSGTSHWRINGNRLEFHGATGKPLAVFERRPLPPAAASASPLQGTAWQLVRFRGGDNTTLMPDDKTKYTIAFGAGGQLTARIDCNRGSGTWKSNGPSQLELGPLALTRAQCPEGSLHDHIVKQWGFIRSYVLKDGHLFLALMADGGTFEFEPMPPAIGLDSLRKPERWNTIQIVAAAGRGIACGH